MAKSRGGLGFRSLHGYNIAMLDKHIWNFIHIPDTLVARVFKAKYFPGFNILDADRTGVSSFIWFGIWAAKEEITKGYFDPWLHKKHDFMVDEVGRERSRDFKVCQLFKPNLLVWDVEKVHRMFSSTDAAIILHTRIPQRDISDRLAWVFNKDGFFQNKKVWDNKVVSSQYPMEWSKKQLGEWRTSKGKLNLMQPGHGIILYKPRAKWVAPATGVLKVNVDVLVIQGDPFFTVSMVM